jgi:hypothetical protein
MAAIAVMSPEAGRPPVQLPPVFHAPLVALVHNDTWPLNEAADAIRAATNAWRRTFAKPEKTGKRAVSGINGKIETSPESNGK